MAGKGGFDRDVYATTNMTEAGGHPSTKAADKSHGMGGPSNTLYGQGTKRAAPTPVPKTSAKGRGR